MLRPGDNVSYTINHAELTLHKELGRGGFGVVYQGTYRHNDVAIKKLLMENISFDAAEEFEREAKVMAQLRSPNIVQFYWYCVSPNYCIVMEYMPNGSLFSVLRSSKPLEWPTRFKIAVDIAKGLSYLHHENILHRDIKSLNVLLDENYKAKLTDFGLSKVKAETKSHTMATKTKSDSVGTVAWMAPELFKPKAVYGQKSDIYSLGITFWELASRQIPYAEASSPELIPIWVREGHREDIPNDCPKELAALIQACWDSEPVSRPGADDVVARLKSAIEGFSSSPSTSSRPGYQGNFNSAQPSVAQYRDNFGSEVGPSKPLSLSPMVSQPVALATVLPQQVTQATQMAPFSSPVQSPTPVLSASSSAIPVFYQPTQSIQSAPTPISTSLQPAPSAVLVPQFAQMAVTSPTPKVKSKELEDFLRRVAKGKQDEVEAMLKKNKDLVLVPGDVTDLSNRAFKNITAFQYAVWALDWHMWTMLRKYLPDDDAREQIQTMETGAWVSQHGQSASWQNLLDALQKHIDLSRKSQHYEAKTQWQKQVGGAQRLLPAHVVNEYCHPKRSFEPCPDFNSSAPLLRTRITGPLASKEEWFTAKNGAVGDKFAVLRGDELRAYVVDAIPAEGTGAHSYFPGFSRAPAVDLKACKALLTTRIHQRNELFAELTTKKAQQHGAK